MIASVLLALLASAQAPGQDAASPEPAEAEAAGAADPAPAEAARESEYAEWLALDPALVHPFRTRTEPVAFEGVELALGDRAATRPGVLLSSFDPQVADAWVRALVARARNDEAVRATLARVRLIVLPALARHGGDAGRFGVDFPVGWKPGSLRRGAAEVPLPSEGTRVLAEWLLARRDLGVVVALDGPDRDVPATDDPAGPLLAAALGSDAVLRPVGGPEDGGWLDHARVACGQWVVAPRANGLAEAGADEVLRLLGELPRLSLRLADAKPLAVGLWQVDLEVANAGGLPCEPPRRAGRRPVAPPALLTVEGVRPVAVARREGEVASFHVGRVRQGAQVEPPLGSRARRTVRLVVQLDGESGEMDVTLASARLGAHRLELRLGPEAGRKPIAPSGELGSND